MTEHLPRQSHPGNQPNAAISGSDSKHVEAFKAAQTDLTEKNKTKTKIRGAAGEIAVSEAGISYWRDNSETTSNEVTLDIVPVDDTTLRVNSMYPTGES